MSEDKPQSPAPAGAPQIKVCGLTSVDEALACVAAGVDAIGLVFYAPSPRLVSDAQAAEITAAVAGLAVTVGVFVDEHFDVIMRTVEKCALPAVQLHGKESPALVRDLRRHNLTVVKALFHTGRPGFDDAAGFDASAFLLECGHGKLPGGNAASWQWHHARNIDHRKPVILAGGLTPQNVSAAIRCGVPDAVDVSSGVESAPGRKCVTKIKAFVRAVSRSHSQMPIGRIF